MKRSILTSLLIILVNMYAIAQQANDIIGIELGYSSTNINFSEAYVNKVKFGIFRFSSGNTFVGDGIYFGIHKNINDKAKLTLAFNSFNGKETNSILNNVENYYTLSGFTIPITLNWLIRAEQRKLNFKYGVGIQFQHAKLMQYQNLINTNTVTLIKEIPFSEVGFTGCIGVQYRIIKDLNVAWTIRPAISLTGRYSDAPILSLSYTFRKKTL